MRNQEAIPTNHTEATSGFQSLAEMSDEFDPDRARALVEQEKNKSQLSPEEVDSLFIQLEDRFGIDKNNPENRELLSKLLGAENRRRQLLEYADTQTDDRDKWNALANAERIRRVSTDLIYDLLPGTYDRNEGYEEEMLKIERIRRQILASPEVKALDEGNANTGYGIKNTYHEFVEPTQEDIDVPATFGEYKEKNGITEPEPAKPSKKSIGQRLKGIFG